MKDFLKTVPCYLIAFTDSGYITYVNDFLLNEIGYSAEEVIGVKKFESLLTVGSKIFYQTHFYPLLRMQDAAEEIHLTLRSAGGDDIPVLMNAAMIHDEDSVEVQCIGMRINQRTRFEREMRDARRIAEAAVQENKDLIGIKDELERHSIQLDQKRLVIQQRNHELSEVNAIISHDLQEPVRKISVLIDKFIAYVQDKLTREERDQLRHIMNICYGMRTLLVNLQNYTSLIAANDAMDQMVDINAVMERLKQIYAVEIVRRQASVNVGPIPGPVEGNYELLFLLFKNLLENSLKFSDPQKSELVIEVSGAEIEDNLYKSTAGRYKYTPHVRIFFRDNGIGLDSSAGPDQIFSLFRRATLDATHTGVGLGLAIVKKIIDLHHGAVMVDSLAGQGTVFTITLPLRHINLYGDV